MKSKRWVAASIAGILLAGAMTAASDRALEQKPLGEKICYDDKMWQIAEDERCPNPKGWQPTDLDKIVNEHGKWLDQQGWKDTSVPGKANLCNANLSHRNLAHYQLNGADLHGAQLVEANLSGIHLIGANLAGAKINSHADLSNAELQGADLRGAQLSWSNLKKANLHKANLSGAWLCWTTLTDAELSEATLSGAQMVGTKVSNAVLAYSKLTNTVYAPDPPPPAPNLVLIEGLQTVRFPQNMEASLVQLRETLQKIGFRELELEATFAIEHGRTQYSIKNWTDNWSYVWNSLTSLPIDFDKLTEQIDVLKADTPAALEGFFRTVFFKWTTAYGLRPWRALLIIAILWALLIPIYIWPIRQLPRSSAQPSGIYRIFPGDRVARKPSEIKPILEKEASIERLERCGWAALGYSAYFSLLSAFNIGFREFNVGSWIVRLQTHEYTLRPVGWVRSVSGAQSLFSVYLLAMWALTYFGRPFY